MLQGEPNSKSQQVRGVRPSSSLKLFGQLTHQIPAVLLVTQPLGEVRHALLTGWVKMVTVSQFSLNSGGSWGALRPSRVIHLSHPA